jgi:ATP-binding cassette, subfamily B, bacterial
VSSAKRPSRRLPLPNAFAVSAWAFKLAWATSSPLLEALLALTALVSMMPAALTWVTRGLINAISDLVSAGSKDMSSVVSWLVLGFGLTAASELAETVVAYLKRRFDAQIEIRITSDVLRHIAALDIAWFDDPEFQDISDRAQQNSAGHFSALINRLIQIGSSVMQAITLIGVLAAVDWLAVVVMTALVLPFAVFKWYQSKARFNTEFTRVTKRRWVRYFVKLLSERESVAEVKLLRLAPVLLKRFHELLNEFYDEDRQLHLREARGTGFFAILFAAGLYLLTARVVGRVLSASLTIGDVALFGGATARLQATLENMVTQAATVMEEVLFVANLHELFQIKPRIVGGRGIRPVTSQGRVEMRGVSFRYPGSHRDVLRDISLRIEPGETVALVGENGAGKSTLVKLIARLYDVDQGEILLDGVDVRKLDLDYLHSEIAFVFQDFNRYEATVEENIAFGDWKNIHQREQVEQIARLANIEPMIDQMPQKYDTLLGRRFGEYDLSGGQWQKIAVARAFARQAALLILDEPTSSLDARAEYTLFSQFKSLAAGRTTLLISHRFSTVSLANRILVMQDGTIIENGTHDQLMALGGQYAHLYDLHQQQHMQNQS